MCKLHLKYFSLVSTKIPLLEFLGERTAKYIGINHKEAHVIKIEADGIQSKSWP